MEMYVYVMIQYLELLNEEVNETKTNMIMVKIGEIMSMSHIDLDCSILQKAIAMRRMEDLLTINEQTKDTDMRHMEEQLTTTRILMKVLEM
jgi:hypothetical protein